MSRSAAFVAAALVVGAVLVVDAHVVRHGNMNGTAEAYDHDFALELVHFRCECRAMTSAIPCLTKRLCGAVGHRHRPPLVVLPLMFIADKGTCMGKCTLLACCTVQQQQVFGDVVLSCPVSAAAYCAEASVMNW